MFFKDDRKGLATLIMKKMSGHGDLKPNFGSSEHSEVKKSVEGVEQDYESGYDACCSDMMSAFKSDNPSKLKSALKSFISMVLDEEEKQEEM
jgi:hypothetical protein